MKLLTRFTFAGLCLMTMAASVSAAWLKGQAVTWADFSRIKHVTSSADYAYFATTAGIIRYDKMQREWEEPLTGSPGVDNTDIGRIWVDLFDEKLFAETSLGLFQYDLFFDRWYEVSEVPSLDNNCVHIRAPAVMYPPIRHNYAADGRIIDPYGRYFFFTDVVDDRSGNLWMGTWGHGAATAGSSSHIVEFLPYGLIQNRVNAIMMLGEEIWVSGAAVDPGRTGISIMDPRTNSFRHIESGVDDDFPAVDINCLEGDDSTVYVGTPLGLLCLDSETGSVRRRLTTRSGLAEDNVLCIGRLGDSLLVGTENGLSLITGSGDSISVIRPHEFSNRIVYDVLTLDSTIWIATSAGAYRFRLPSGRLQQIQDPDFYLNGRVYDIEPFGDDLWFATEDAVVRVNTVLGDIEPFPTSDRTGDARALAVNEWIVAYSSNRGITIIYYTDKNRNTREFTTDDGLASNYVYSLLMDGDYLWIGSDRGLTRFLWNNPDRVD
ncbi:MAG: hypothetical protein KAU35_08090 [candidate division Zixibacteria bacterium]|nr:hypothetical protein [candidate division Zixibacteria bacterium]